jgi:hypothetical protein
LIPARGLGVERLAKLHNVHAVLAQRRSSGRSGGSFARRELELYHRLDFLCHALYLRAERKLEIRN